MNIKVLASFPQLVNMGGSERVLEIMSKYFDLTIITNKYNPNKTFESFKNINIIETKKFNKFLFGTHLATHRFNDYDVFHSHGYFINNFLAIRNHPTLYYCITPKRDIYKLREYYLKQLNPLSRLIKNQYLDILKIIDRSLIRRTDDIVTISREVQQEVKKIYNIDSKVIYPPTDLTKYKNCSSEDFYLCVSRISPVKRIETIVQAFNKMPSKKLKIIGSIADPVYAKKVMSMAKTNIKFLTDVTDDELINLYSRCIASIYLPVKEDFALVAVEALASGKPVILANEGALPEIIENKKHGFLIKPEVQELISAIEHLDKIRASKMKKSCLARSKLFGEKEFAKKLTTVYKNLMN